MNGGMKDHPHTYVKVTEAGPQFGVVGKSGKVWTIRWSYSSTVGGIASARADARQFADDMGLKLVDECEDQQSPNKER